jgi:cytochrome c553
MDGISTVPDYPKLAGQYPDYLAKALRDYKSGARKNPIMAGFAQPLSDKDIVDLAAYFAAQPSVLTSRY